MSFFSDILGSIGTGQSPAPPRPIQKNTAVTPNHSTNPPATALASERKTPAGAPSLVARPANGNYTAPVNSLKEKAGSEIRGIVDKALKADTSRAATSNATTGLPLPLIPRSKASADSTGPSVPSINSAQVISKAPPKGSFADIMARAKAAQEQRGQNQVGMILHQASSKEKLSKKAMQRRRDDDKTRSDKGKSTNRTVASGRVEKRKSASPAKKRDEPKNIKAPRPPLSAPASSYKGTMGQPARRPPANGRNGKRPSKYNDYLGTDEEDIQDEDDEVGDEAGYGSDVSSDMEAGAFDIDEEEAAAGRKAKEDDARELALENKLKREKEERRRKLQALADKRR